jgi:hypothetical protein
MGRFRISIARLLQVIWVVPEPFRVICHALLTPIVAFLGGLLARRLHRTRDESEG